MNKKAKVREKAYYYSHEFIEKRAKRQREKERHNF